MNIDGLREQMREKVLTTHDICVDKVMAVIEGKAEFTSATKEASKMIQRCLRVDQEMRMERENAASLTLRFVRQLDGDKAAQKRYIDMTQPYLPPAVRAIEDKRKKK